MVLGTARDLHPTAIKEASTFRHGDAKGANRWFPGPPVKQESHVQIPALEYQTRAAKAPPEVFHQVAHLLQQIGHPPVCKEERSRVSAQCHTHTGQVLLRYGMMDSLIFKLNVTVYNYYRKLLQAYKGRAEDSHYNNKKCPP